MCIRDSIAYDDDIEKARQVILKTLEAHFGNVEDITLFTTDMQTFDNQKIIIPNGKIWGEKIINHSHHPVRGVEMKFNIAYDDDIEKARQVILKTLEAHPHIKSDPAPFVEVESLTERSAEILARPFACLLYTSPSPRDATLSRMPSSA